jgi:hypothetical protein
MPCSRQHGATQINPAASRPRLVAFWRRKRHVRLALDLGLVSS